jgi:fructosamine-3-kinase
MKAILEFELPGDEDAHKVATRGWDYFYFIRELDNEMRNCLKYGHKFKTPEEVMEHIRELIADVPIDDIA